MVATITTKQAVALTRALATSIICITNEGFDVEEEQLIKDTQSTLFDIEGADTADLTLTNLVLFTRILTVGLHTAESNEDKQETEVINAGISVVESL